MATTGELLVQMSTLSTGSALDHFTNISFGGGGVGADDATPYSEQSFVELLFMNQNLPGIGDQDGLRGSAVVGNIYVALYTDENTEASYSGYTRVPIVRGAPGWEFKDGGAKNIPIATWQPNGGSPVIITHFAIVDSLQGGSALFKKELPSPVNIPSGDQVEFAYNQLTVKMN